MKPLDLQGKIFVLLLVGGVIFLCLLLTYRALTGPATYDLYPFYRMRVTEAQPCLGLDEAGRPIDIIEPFRTSGERLQVCARLEVEYIGLKGYDVPLHFLWRYEGEPEYLSESHMYRQGRVPKLFISGDNRSNKQADAMAAYAQAHGVAAGDIVVDRLGILIQLVVYFALLPRQSFRVKAQSAISVKARV